MQHVRQSTFQTMEIFFTEGRATLVLILLSANLERNWCTTSDVRRSADQTLNLVPIQSLDIRMRQPFVTTPTSRWEHTVLMCLAACEKVPSPEVKTGLFDIFLDSIFQRM